jgi:beta-carotene 3-hydroxylase
VHERLPMRSLLALRIFRRIRGAHLVHHRTGGPPYGLFLGPRELTRHRRELRGRGVRPSAPSSSVRAPS